MKKLLPLAFLLAAYASPAQRWARMMQDPVNNFYDTQKEFSRYWKEQERHNNNFFRKLFSKNEEEEKAGYEVFKRWEWFYKPRVYPSGKMPEAGALWNEWIAYKNHIGNSQLQVLGNWTPLGPDTLNYLSYSPGIGRVNAVAVDPSNSNNVYVGAPAGGFWKSNDGGATWITTTDLLPSIGVSSIAVDPFNSNVIFIGTGDRDAGDSYSIGILKSTDGGFTWNQTGLSWLNKNNRLLSKILIDPNNNQYMLAASNVGIYKSLDGGVTWSLILLDNIKDIEFKPGSTNVIYACGTKFYRSTDNGNTFSQVITGLPPSSFVNRIAMAVTPANSSVVYVVGGNSGDSGFNGLYFSTDDGQTFVQQSTTPNVLGWDTDGLDAGGQSWYDLTISASPVNANEILVGGVNIWQSFDAGVTWTINAHWVYNNGFSYVHADQHHMDYTGNDLWVGTDGGVFKSSDYGLTYTNHTPGIAISQFYRLGTSQLNPGIVMAGAQDNGCLRMDNGIWGQVYGADGMEVAVDPSNSQICYVESQEGGLRRSSNGGVTTTDIKNNINETGDWLTPYVIDQTTATNLYAGFVNVWKSTNRGNSWTQISAFAATGTITALHIAPSNPDYIYIVKSGTFYRTTDGGLNWSTITVPFASMVTYVAIDPQNPDRFWVSLSGYVKNKRVYYTTDGGVTWTNVSGSLPGVPVNTIVYQNNSADGLYVGTDLGVFYRDTTLTNWIPFFNGLPNVKVTELEIQYATSKIRAATYGRGIWESNVYTIPVNPPLADFVADKINVCPNDPVTFTDLSVGAAPGWNWIFNGGNPSSSTAANPVVTYPSSGTYDVQLTVSNVNGNNTSTKVGYINVSGPAVFSGSFTEDFQSGVFPLNGWRLDNLGNDNTWHLDNSAGGYGNSSTSMSLDNYFNDNPGSRDILLTAAYDLTQVTNPVLKFDYAYSFFSPHPDSLRVFYTNDCGITRTNIFSKGGAQINSAPSQSGYFIPLASQWKTVTLSLASVPNLFNIQFGFEGINNYGNVLYIDNINVNTATGVNEWNDGIAISVYPNPFAEHLTVDVPTVTSYEIEITDMLGRTELREKLNKTHAVIFTGTFPKGIYTCTISNIKTKQPVFRNKIIFNAEN